MSSLYTLILIDQFLFFAEFSEFVRESVIAFSVFGVYQGRPFDGIYVLAWIVVFYKPRNGELVANSTGKEPRRPDESTTTP